MKNAKLKKVLACLLTAACVAGLLAGCGSKGGDQSADNASQSQQTSQQESKQEGQPESQAAQEETAEPAESAAITYPLEGNPTFTIAVIEEATITAYYENIAEAPFGQAWQENTGVTLKVDQYNWDSMPLMMASGDLPDIIFFPFPNYSGGITKAVSDGVVQPITDYTEFCPDLMAVMESNDDYRRSNTTPDGDLIGFPIIRGDEYLLTSMGIVIRKDFLDSVNRDLPQTPEEFHDVLKAFKEELNVEKPFTTDSYTLLTYAGGQGIMTSPFGLPCTDFYVKDGQTHLGYYEEEMKGFLEFLHQLYDEELLDPNFVVGGDANADLMNGVAGCVMTTPGGGMGTMLQTMEGDPNFDLAGCGPLVAKDGDTPMMTHYDWPVNGAFAVITPACKDIENAVKFLNYGYSEEGHMFFNFGTEGVSYEMVDGYPTYTELLTNNPDGKTFAEALAQYTRGSFSHGGMVQDKRYMEQYAGRPQQKQALSQWTKSDAKKYKMPNVTIPVEDSAEYSSLKTDIDTYVTSAMTEFITGERSLDEYDAYLDDLKGMGADRLIEIQQKAYDEFMSR